MNSRANYFVKWGVTLAAAGLAVATVIFVAAHWLDGPVSTWSHTQNLDTNIANRRTTAHALSIIAKIPGEWYGALATLVLVVLIETFHTARPWHGRPARAEPSDKQAAIAAEHGRDAHATDGPHSTIAVTAPRGTGVPPVRRNLLYPLFIFLSALASSLNGLVKWIPGRQRPRRNGEYFGDYADLHWFRDGWSGLFHQSNLSFPSGHACQAFALATALAILYPRWGWLAFLYAIITATERVLSNSHYVSDVVGGAALGTAGAVAVWCILRSLVVRFSPPSLPQ